MKTNTLADFQICISVPLKTKFRDSLFLSCHIELTLFTQTNAFSDYMLIYEKLFIS